MNIYPLHDKIVIKPIIEEKTQSGLYLPESSKNSQSLAEVVATGPGRFDNGNLIPISVTKGDKVIYSKFSGTEIEIAEEKFLVIRENDILAKIN